MPSALYIWIFCCVTICVGQAHRPSGQEYQKSTYLSKRKTNCHDVNWRMVSDNDITGQDQELLHLFTDPIWIHVTMRRTSWVIHKGLFDQINKQSILAQTNISHETQFISCILYCSKYEWYYIGLQIDTCYCLSSGALIGARSFPNYPHNPCQKDFIPICANSNVYFAMSVFEKDTNIYPGNEDCLSAKLSNNVFESVLTTPCSSSDNLGLCLENKTTELFYRQGSRAQRSRVHCSSSSSLVIVDFRTLNSTSPVTSNLNNGNYWVNNFRESYVLNPVIDRKPQSLCVTGKVENGTIQLQKEDCNTKKAYTLCIKDARHTSVSTLQHTTATIGTDLIPIGSSTLIIIGSAVSVSFLIVLILIVILIRYRKHMTISSANSPVYATVQKEMIHSADEINHGNHPDVTQALIEEDSMYDHTDCTSRNPLKQTDASNYDTMENIQVTGESIYHHTVTFKSLTGITQGDESVYHHTTDFKFPTENEQN